VAASVGGFGGWQGVVEEEGQAALLQAAQGAVRACGAGRSEGGPGAGGFGVGGAGFGIRARDIGGHRRPWPCLTHARSSVVVCPPHRIRPCTPEPMPSSTDLAMDTGSRALAPPPGRAVGRRYSHSLTGRRPHQQRTDLLSDTKMGFSPGIFFAPGTRETFSPGWRHPMLKWVLVPAFFCARD